MYLTLRKFLVGLDNFYLKVISKAGGRLFCTLFNLRSIFRFLDIRFRYKGPQSPYVAFSNEESRSFFAKYQNSMTYSSGFKRRAEVLGAAYLLDLIEFNSGDVIVDCGANVGDLKLYFQKRTIEIEYIGIEPSPLEYRCLQLNTSPSKTMNIGLWNEDGSLNFYLSSSYGDSSFIKPDKYDEIKDISVKRLDSIYTGKIKLLKLEAEGAEPEAIMGCEKLLPSIEYITADLGFERGINQESTLAPVINYLLKNDFELIRVGYPRIVALFKNTKL